MTENATPAAQPLAAPPAPGLSPTVLAARQDRRTTRRVLLINGLGLLVLLLVGMGAYYVWHEGNYFYKTDDATVSAPTAQVAPPAPGSLVTVRYGQGSTVRAGDTVATIRTASGRTVNVTSPLAGTIIQEDATPGEVLAAGQPLAQVADLSRAFVTAYVEETHIKDVQVGQGVDVRIDSIGDTTYHGTMARIQPVAASALSPLPTTDYGSGNFTKVTQRVPVEITLDGYQVHTLYPGASAEVTIHIHQ